MKILSLIFRAAMTIFFFSCSEQKAASKLISYSIDKDAMKGHVVNAGSLWGAPMEAQWMKNDKHIAGGEHTPYNMVSTIKGDTISVTLSPQFAPGRCTVVMDFVNDSVIARQIEVSTLQDSIFKYSATDPYYTTSVRIKPVVCRVILVETPVVGQSVEGFIEFEGEPYFSKESDKAVDAKNIFKLKGFFKSNQRTNPK